MVMSVIGCKALSPKLEEGIGPTPTVVMQCPEQCQLIIMVPTLGVRALISVSGQKTGKDDNSVNFLGRRVDLVEVLLSWLFAGHFGATF